MIDFSTLTIAFFIGLLGGAHCIGMCGGIIGALTMGVSAPSYSQRLLMISAYNVGRIVSYSVLAALLFLLIKPVENFFALNIMRYVAGFLLIAMGLYLANWWRGLVYLEKAGSYLWRYIQPVSRSLLPVKNPWQALLLGAVWGWLPCGLIYSALVYAGAANNLGQAMLTMLAFGLGTLPAVMASGLLAERLTALIRHTHIRQLFALSIIAFGIWTLINIHAPGTAPESVNSHSHH